MSNLRKRTMSAVMALLFVSMALPGCLSLALCREMMEGARGPPTVSNMATYDDLSHTFVINTEAANYFTQEDADADAHITITNNINKHK